MVEKESGAFSRRYDVDWLRTIALVLLIVYHAMISFRMSAHKIGFPEAPNSIEWLEAIMTWLNVWRIPLLFVISGMGTAFALRRRSVGDLVKDRTRRFLEPLLFGSFVIVPLTTVFFQLYTGTPLENIAYKPGNGHLWFLSHLAGYVILTLPLIAATKKYPDGLLLRLLERGLHLRGMVLLLFGASFALEAWLNEPQYFATWVIGRFVAGWICFGFGFLMVSVGQAFWDAVERDRWLFATVGSGLYLIRLVDYGFVNVPNPLLAIESTSWMLTCFGFAAVHLNHPSARLRYLNGAVYPIYILHMPIQYMLSIFILPLDAPPLLLLSLLVVGVLGISWAIYHIVLRQIIWLHWAFGISEAPPEQ